MNYSFEHALVKEKVLNRAPEVGYKDGCPLEMDLSRVEVECIKPRRSSVEVLFGTVVQSLGNFRAIKRPPVQKTAPSDAVRASHTFFPFDEEPLSKLELVVMVSIPIFAVLATWILWFAYG